ncbi:MAG: heme ABC exporter ATP-binding protein CcmA [Sphingobium sp.]|nr:heme ABC exporter ATP-binding protein CcmA [Sphingobium sp.]
MSAATSLTLADLACLRGGRLLFAGLNLALGPGEAALLTGPNGIGKSSLMRLCAGLLRPFAGRVERSGGIAMADERLALDIDRALGDALKFWAALDGGERRVDAALDSLALAPLRAVPVRMLSTGQRKRAMLARVMASGAPIWLLDEPANGLDSDSVALLGRIVADHLAAGGIVLAASHQPLPLTARAVIDLTDHVPVEA